MSEKYTFSTTSNALPFLCSELLDSGDEVGSRNGRVKELLNTQIVLTDPQRREVLTIGRKANVFAQIAETMWVLAGRNDIEWLSPYLPRAKDYSDDGETWRAGYGPRIRKWGGWPHQDKNGAVGLDQLAYVVDTLRADPLSRQAVIGIWDPSMDTTPGLDKACNTQLQFQSRLGALHLTVTVRSNDIMWGWSGINAFEWSTIQEIVAHLLSITVGTLTFNIGNLHLYEQHWARAERLGYEDDLHAITPFRLPSYADPNLATVDTLIDRWFAWEGMCREGTATREAYEEFEEPLFKSWAAAIAWYWQREHHWLETLRGTALAVAIARTPASALSEAPRTSRRGAPVLGHHPAASERSDAFYHFVKDLHAKKHESYGDSWKKRGEKMSILPNMARKVDRLGVGDEYDSSADTLIDLLVYTLKYGCWLQDKDDGPANVNLMLLYFLAETEKCVDQAVDIAIVDIVDEFNHYCDTIDEHGDEAKRHFVKEFARRVAPIARDVWYEETYGTHIYKGADAD